MKYDVFISYSRRDAEIIDRIESELNRYGISCFVDRSGINPGEDYAEVIAKALFESDLMLFVWSENSNQSRETANEVALAIDFEKTVIPFKIGKFQADYKLAYRLVRFNRIDAVTYNEQKIVELGEKIAHQLNRSLVVETPKAASAVPEKQVEKVDAKIEKEYQKAIDLMKRFEVREAFDAIYPLALIEYKDSVDRLVYFTAKGLEKLFMLSDGQIAGLKKDADNGVPLAMYLYSTYLRLHNLEEAFVYARMAEDRGFALAKLALSKCYDLGVGVAIDNDLASKLMVESMEAGALAAKDEYIRYVYHGYDFKQDKDWAVRMWEHMASEGCEIAYHRLTDHYLNTKYWDVDKIVYYAEKSIACGFFEDYLNLAYAYGMDKYFNLVNADKYIEYLMKGAEYNERNAMSALATAYYLGTGVQQNKKHAERWAKRGAEVGDRCSMYILSQIYYYGGDGIAENEAEAWKWAKLGAERSDMNCWIALGNMCKDGYGMEGNTKADCVKFYERAAYLGNTAASQACIELYLIYSEGKFGVRKDLAKAVSYLKPLAEDYEAQACLLYGKLLTSNDSEYCDEFLGVKYLKLACEAGQAEAYYRLGKLYETGFGVIKSDAKAKEMIAKAKELGYNE